MATKQAVPHSTPASKYAIQKDVALPGANFGDYPFAYMEVGDSFEVPEAEVKNLQNQANKYRKQNNWGFTMRKTDQGSRIWYIGEPVVRTGAPRGRKPKVVLDDNGNPVQG